MKTNFLRTMFRRACQAIVALPWLMLSLCPVTGYSQEFRSYYVTDVVGSPVVSTDSYANATWTEDYRPYGDRIVQTSYASTDGNNERWFTGAPQNDASGLIDLGSRYYDPVAARFISVDPVGPSVHDGRNFNRYWYANNNPYRFVDPTGEEGAEIIQNADIQALLHGRMSQQEYSARIKARGVGGLIGGAIGGTVLVAPEIAVSYLANPIAWNTWGIIGLEALSGAPFMGGSTLAPQVSTSPQALASLAWRIRAAAQSPAAYNMKTVAVVWRRNGDFVVGSSSYLDKGMREMAQKLGLKIVSPVKGLHAEEALTSKFDDIAQMGVSRAPCGADKHNCAQQLIDAGIAVAH